jgi:haloalkane dehalogenase
MRTPEQRFDGLPGFPWEPHYLDIEGWRLARVDEGQGHPVVLVHGMPTWSYLYRTVIPPVLDAGLRAVAPDLVGFGRSDKPERDWYSYDAVVASFGAHLDAIGLDEPITLVVHDWGGPIGLRWAVEHRGRVARLVVLDTGLYAMGSGATDARRAFSAWVASADALPVGGLLQGGTSTTLPDEVVAAYEAPFPDAPSQAALFAHVLMVPLDDDAPAASAMAATLEALSSWQQPTLVIWGAEDPILGPRIGERLSQRIPGTVAFETVDASHFLQEDAGPELGARIAQFVASDT